MSNGCKIGHLHKIIQYKSTLNKIITSGVVVVYDLKNTLSYVDKPYTKVEGQGQSYSYSIQKKLI